RLTVVAHEYNTQPPARICCRYGDGIPALQSLWPIPSRKRNVRKEWEMTGSRIELLLCCVSFGLAMASVPALARVDFSRSLLWRSIGPDRSIAIEIGRAHV